MNTKTQIISIAALSILLLGSCGESPKPTEKPLEYKVAFLDGGESAAQDVRKVSIYRLILGELASAFECTDEEIANMTRSASKDLSVQLNRNVTMLEVMQGISKINKSEGGIIVGKGTRAYAEQLAILATLMRHPNESSFTP